MKLFTAMLLILLSVCTFSCSSNQRRFDDYLDTLDELELPVTFDINSKMEASQSHDALLFKNYKHVWTFAPYGIAFKKGQVTGVIEYSIGDFGRVPFLVTFDKKGNKIDSLNMMAKTRRTRFGETLSYAVLYQGLKLVVTDSSQIWLLDEDNEIERVTEISVSTITYQVQPGGQIALIDQSEPIVTNPKVESIEPKGIYQYTYKYNTENLIENHYLEFVGEKAFYYGTSDDFDEAREGYYPGFFITEIDSLILNGNRISFDLDLDNLAFYTKPITPFHHPSKNEPWDNSFSIGSRTYKGKINGDTIVITTEGFDSRTFIKKEKH